MLSGRSFSERPHSHLGFIITFSFKHVLQTCLCPLPALASLHAFCFPPLVSLFSPFCSAPLPLQLPTSIMQLVRMSEPTPVSSVQLAACWLLPCLPSLFSPFLCRRTSCPRSCHHLIAADAPCELTHGRYSLQFSLLTLGCESLGRQGKEKGMESAGCAPSRGGSAGCKAGGSLGNHSVIARAKCLMVAWTLSSSSPGES